MFAPYDTSPTVAVLPGAVTSIGPPQQQLEKRAVESVERGLLPTEDKPNVLYDSTAAVLQLVEGSAENFAQIIEAAPQQLAGEAGRTPESGGVGETVDVYV